MSLLREWFKRTLTLTSETMPTTVTLKGISTVPGSGIGTAILPLLKLLVTVTGLPIRRLNVLVAAPRLLVIATSTVNSSPQTADDGTVKGTSLDTVVPAGMFP